MIADRQTDTQTDALITILRCPIGSGMINTHTERDTHRKANTKSSAIAEGPHDASCQLKSCQLPHNSAETTYTTSPDQIDGIVLGDLVGGNA